MTDRTIFPKLSNEKFENFRAVQSASIHGSQVYLNRVQVKQRPKNQDLKETGYSFLTPFWNGNEDLRFAALSINIPVGYPGSSRTINPPSTFSSKLGI